MKLVRWTRFTWDLQKLPALDRPLEKPYALRSAIREEEAIVAKVIQSAFALDNDWSDAFHLFKDRLQTQLHLAFERESLPALVITHGQRIIAASALTTETEPETHLISGPCVLIEYRNRGLGTALLHYSLKHLQSAGLTRAYGISKNSAPATKFIYPKFGSTQTKCAFEPALATS